MTREINTCQTRGEVVFQGASQGSSSTPTFKMRAYTGASVNQFWRDSPLVLDLAGFEPSQHPTPIDKDHRSEQGVGHTTEVRVVERDGLAALEAEGKVSRTTEAARDVVESSKLGFPWQASVEAPIYSIEEVEDDATVTVNGREFRGPIGIARRWSLSRISVVDLGADPDTRTQIAAKRGEKGDRHMTPNNPGTDAGELAQAAGSTQGTDNAQGTQGNGQTARAGAEGQGAGSGNGSGSQAGTATAAPAPQGLEEMRAAGKAEADRRQRIMEAAERATQSRPELSDDIYNAATKAIESKTDPGTVELEMLRLSRDVPGVGSPRGDREQGTNSMLEAALCMAGGMSTEDAEKHFDADTLQAGEDRFGRTAGILDAILVAAKQNGYDGISVKQDLEGAMRAAFSRDRSSGRVASLAGASTISLPNVFSNVANKFLRIGFMSIEDEWRKIASIGSNRDFKPKTTLTLVGDYTFKKLPESGEIEHGKPGELTYASQVDTFGRMLSITRKQITNDDLDALTQIPRRLGRGAGLAHRSDFWSVFQDDASFFTAGNNNLETGAGSALDIDALTKAETTFMTQTDPDGNPLGVMPRKLLVHPSNRATAFQLVNSTEVRGGSSMFGVANPHAGRYEIVVSQYINTPAHWWLLADPNDLPVIEASFLNGRQRPIIETAQADFDTLGVNMRGYWDFGNDKQEFRGGVKNTGS